ncbi:hypothetical protein GCM10010124_22380 [Pilimelia terevasa]|uniref:Glycosyltransferase n=1 Tax=Pilimelia terevasa TaxID=53372 RepID=A0A8J3BL80_9ACTN|nr:glycosyltransferase [Pilimelia terevasa]GGK29145.1 hypothetical protein GCM10010124_22380 [Pilimelia terevasa]
MSDARPDVDVIVPVYNTMPYLRQCLDSLVGQSIGARRMHVVAVDDGSTDGSGRELDRYARRHPGLFTVVHQANSGGPAGPCNRGLDAATGRYVFFVGADDRLAPDALARLVDAADAHGADVVLGRVVGVNSRHIFQDIFARDAVDVGLADSPLARSLGNTKLFRRELIERYGIRYPLGWPLGSDQPFTLEACHRAARVSVLADQPYYYAVRRHGATNITYLSRHRDRLTAVGAMLAFASRLLPPGAAREAVLRHYVDHNIGKLLQDDLLLLDRATQREVHHGVGRLVAAHLTPEIADRLPAQTRIRAALCRDGALDDLLDAVRHDATAGTPGTLVEEGRRYARYPGLRRGDRPVPDSCFEVTAAPDWPARLDVAAAAWRRGADGADTLVLTARSPLPDLPATLAVAAEDVPAATRVTGRDAAGTTVEIGFRVPDLLAGGGRRRCVSARLGPADPTRSPGSAGIGGAAALRAPRWTGGARRVRRRGTRLYLVAPVRDGSGDLLVSVVPLTAGRLLARAGRVLARAGRALAGVGPALRGRRGRGAA